MWNYLSYLSTLGIQKIQSTIVQNGRSYFIFDLGNESTGIQLSSLTRPMEAEEFTSWYHYVRGSWIWFRFFGFEGHGGDKTKAAKTTVPGIPAWSPTAVLTWR